MREDPTNYVERIFKDAKEKGKPSILTVHLDTLPIPEFWIEHFSDIENNYVWKLDSQNISGGDMHVGVWCNEKLPFVWMIAVSPEVMEYIKLEIYKYDK
jgi:hypothetical protein